MSLLSASDSRVHQTERSGQPLHHGLVLLVKAKPLRQKSGALDMDAIRDRVHSRLRRAPRFRQRLERHGLPGNFRWVWRDDVDFDITFHVRHAAVPFPGDDRHLLELVNRLLSAKLDRTRPLWELYIIENLEDDRVALVYKAHPLLIEAQPATDLLTALIDAAPDVEDLDPDPWEPASPPPVEVVGEVLESSLVNAVANTTGAVDLLNKTIRGAGRAATSFAGGKPQFPWEVEITAHRRFEPVRISLDRVVEAKRANGCSFNDVVLAACTDALRTFLESRDVPIEGRDVATLIPLAIATEKERENPGFAGGRLRMVGVDLPVGETDASARLDRIAAQLSRVRADRRVLDATTMMDLEEFAAPTLLALAARESASIDDRLVVVNVPGSRAKRWFCGAEVLEVFPYLGIGDGRALTIATISHGDQLGFGITGDRSRMPDLHHFARYLRDALDALV